MSPIITGSLLPSLSPFVMTLVMGRAGVLPAMKNEEPARCNIPLRLGGSRCSLGQKRLVDPEEFLPPG